MKKSKFFIVNGIIIGVLVVVFLAVNIAVGVLFKDLTRVFEGTGFVVKQTPEADQAREEGEKVAAKIVEEGIVLLRNENNALPIKNKGNINLFGWATVSHIRGGDGGSGGATSKGIVTIKESLENAGFTVNNDLLAMYENYGGSRGDSPDPDDAKYGGYKKSWGTPEPAIGDETLYTAELKSAAKAFSQTAVVTIARGSGECVDIPEGYLSLTPTEKDMLAYVRDNYEKMIVVVNSNSVMEIGYLEEIDADAVLFMPGTGAKGVAALGKILSGEVNPSGKTVDTMPYDHKEIPSYYYANRPGTFEYADKTEAKYVDYVEGIYVGYKYWETAYAEGTIDYAKSVQYPFGHGLSYTTFTQEVVSVGGDLRADEITVTVKVKNTGNENGKDVVQIYATPEYRKGGIEKAYVDLVGFTKTKELEPQEETTVTVKIDPFEIASYDNNDANGDGKYGYILEKGKYELKLMRDAHKMIAVAKEYDLSGDILIEKDPVSETEITNLFDEADGRYETTPVQYLSRRDFKATFPKADPVARTASQRVTEGLLNKSENDLDAAPVTTGADNGIKATDLTELEYDDPLWSKFLDQFTLDEMVTLTKQGGFKTESLERLGLSATTATDGPQGINAWWMFMSGKPSISGVSYPSQIYLAQTWNLELVAGQADALAKECAAYDLSGLYAPAVNIHRTPYSGRNFEYYSEDGFMSGKLSAASCFKLRENGIMPYVKHFALNDQETWRGERFTGLFTFANEQSIREIYLKPFELSVKEGKATAMMSSFNRIGYTWTGGSKALSTGLLRDEWGFRGVMLTDMHSSGNDFQDYEQGLRAGNNLWLSFFGSDAVLNCDTANPTTQNALRESTHSIVYAVLQCSVLPGDVTPNWWYHIGLPIDIVCGVLILGYIGFYVYKIIRAKKKKE